MDGKCDVLLSFPYISAGHTLWIVITKFAEAKMGINMANEIFNRIFGLISRVWRVTVAAESEARRSLRPNVFASPFVQMF